MNNQTIIEPKTNLRNIVVIVLLTLSAVVVVAITGCAKQQTADPGQEELIQTIKNITPEEALVLIQDNQNNPEFLIIDVRTPEEFAREYIENAVNINFHSATFRDDLKEMDRSKIYLIYCRSGRRSGLSIPVMKELGFMEVYHLLGGIVRWEAEGLPITR